MRVLHLIHNLEIGGAQVVLRNLIEGQLGTGVEPVIAAWKRGGPIRDELRAPPSSVEVVATATSGALLKTWRWLEGMVERHRPDVIHAHMPDSGFWAGALGHRKGLPYIVSYYSNRLLFHTINRHSPYGRLRWSLVRLGAARAAANVACAESVRGQIVEDLGLAHDDIDVVFNGVPVPPDEELPWSAGAPGADTGGNVTATIITVGRLESIKGQHQLVECAPRVLERHPDARLIIVGDGPRREEWEAQARRLQVSDAVTFTGRVPDPVPYLQQADVYVSPSRYEGISLGVLEAMSRGIPVVASEVAGNVDVITNGVEGLLFALDDDVALADAICRVIEDNDAARVRARTARQRVINQFSAQAMSQGYERVYKKAVRRRC